jgi:hypothetical protein
MNPKELYDWLKSLGSHTAYDWDTVWAKLQPSDLTTYELDPGADDAPYKVLQLGGDWGFAGIPFQRAGHARANPQLKGLFVSEEVPDDEYLCGGWQIASAIAVCLTGESCSEYSGRGRRFISDLQIIKAHFIRLGYSN